MTKLDGKREICDAIERVMKSFEPDELALLMLSGKAETHFRDRLVWDLHKKHLADPDVWLKKEWNTVDLAMLNRQAEPQVLLEAKVFNSFNRDSKFITRLTDLRGQVQRAKAEYRRAEVFALTAVPHARPHPGPDMLPRELLMNLIQDYDKQWEKFLHIAEERGQPEEHWLEIEERIDKHFGSRDDPERWDFDGQVYGFPTCIKVSLWGPNPRWRRGYGPSNPESDRVSDDPSAGRLG